MDGLALPKVSVIIVNYNYGHLLKTAVASVAAQTYPNIELIIVDDKSTDDSRTIIDEICAATPATIPVKLEENSGQTIASLRGFEKSTGFYVLFLDADDQLLPTSIESHVAAQFSSRIHVAFTTVDIVHNVLGQDVCASSRGFHQHVTQGVGRRAASVRLVNDYLPSSWFGSREPVFRVEDLHYVPPGQTEPWVWSPSSANCYRRDAVAFLLQEHRLAGVRWGTDALLIRPLSAMFGSLLIDRPLMRYVTHGSNYFARGAPLQHLNEYDPKHTEDYTTGLTRIVIEALMADAPEFGARIDPPDVFFAAMRALSDGWGMNRQGGDFYLAALQKRRAPLVEAFGAAIVDREVARRKRARSLEDLGNLLPWRRR